MRSPNWDARSKHRESDRKLYGDTATICTVCVSEYAYVCVIYLYLYLYLYLYVYFYVIPDLFVLAAPHVAPPSLYVCVRMRMRVYVPFTSCDMHNSGLLIYIVLLCSCIILLF